MTFLKLALVNLLEFIIICAVFSWLIERSWMSEFKRCSIVCSKTMQVLLELFCPVNQLSETFYSRTFPTRWTFAVFVKCPILDHLRFCMISSPFKVLGCLPLWRLMLVLEAAYDNNNVRFLLNHFLLTSIRWFTIYPHLLGRSIGQDWCVIKWWALPIPYSVRWRLKHNSAYHIE